MVDTYRRYPMVVKSYRRPNKNFTIPKLEYDCDIETGNKISRVAHLVRQFQDQLNLENVERDSDKLKTAKRTVLFPKKKVHNTDKKPNKTPIGKKYNRKNMAQDAKKFNIFSSKSVYNNPCKTTTYNYRLDRFMSDKDSGLDRSQCSNSLADRSISKKSSFSSGSTRQASLSCDEPISYGSTYSSYSDDSDHHRCTSPIEQTSGIVATTSSSVTSIGKLGAVFYDPDLYDLYGLKRKLKINATFVNLMSKHMMQMATSVSKKRMKQVVKISDTGMQIK